ncbi:hypothetical protein [Desulfallas thermosapovorans]|uniref:Uncharacterized protein n=1 Tax=Desulfallas thermosapovorans DSM 6562 TaxID=1121431 RepID=A0A5S4ZQ30_9FIRM|nr:hypothetical protein [Desulfallas thermosapovorans]TYO95002.1 hypothetical protein LX24_02019 [Desulfallas thermosapovorans DSM 6562]
MLIEIFTKQLDKKNTVLTLLSTEPQLQATGDKITVPGLVLHINANYLLFNVTSPAWAERVVPLLFSVKPINAAGQFYEPVSDAKIIVTAKSLEPTRILPHLHELSHLDMERGELLGVRLVEWRSRDVAVVAHADLAVQGGIITARIKYNPHFRDSQYNCRACIEQVSISEVLMPLCHGFTKPPITPQVTGPVIQAQQTVPGSGWAEFVNQQPAPVIYRQKTDSYMVDLGKAGHINFVQNAERREIFCSIAITDPQVLSTDLLKQLHDLLGFKELKIQHKAVNVLLPSEQLVGKLSFIKEPDFHLFSIKCDYFTAIYDIKKLTLVISASVKINREDESLDFIRRIHSQMIEFMHKVLEYAL